MKISSTALLWCERLLALIVILFFLWYTIFHTIESGRKNGAGKTDFAVFYAAGLIVRNFEHVPAVQVYKFKYIKSVIKTLHPYNGGVSFLYPPPAAIFFAPLTFLKFEVAVVIWATINVLATVCAFWLVIHYFFGDRYTRFRYSALLLLFSFSTEMNFMVSHGQVNGVLLLLMILGFFALRQNAQIWSGVALGTAAVIKLFPIIFLPYLIVKKQWKAAMSFFITCCGWFVLAWPFFKTEGLRHFFVQRIPKLLHGNVGFHDEGSSIYSSLHNIFMDYHLIYQGVPLARTLKVVYPYCALVILAIIFLYIWKKRQQHASVAYIFEYGILISTFLLLSQATHLEFHVWIVPPLLYWLSTASRGSVRMRWSKAIAAFVFYVLHSLGESLRYIGINFYLPGKFLLLLLLRCVYYVSANFHT